MLDERSKLFESKTTGKDEKVDLLLSSSDPEELLTYQKAKVLNKSKLKKSYIEASLLCETDLAKVAEVIEIPLPVVTVYRDFFFDVVDFDRLSKLEHIESISDSDKNEMLLKMWALSHGLDFISWRLGKRVNLSPIEGLTDLFSTCIYKSKEAMFNPSSTDASKESTKWTKLSTDIARLLKMWVMDSSAAKKDLVLAIREVVPEFEGISSLLELNNEIEDQIFDTGL